MNMRSLVAVILLMFILTGCSYSEEDVNRSEFRAVEVDWIIDGDTFRTTEGEKIRVIGINTPEVNNRREIFGQESLNFAISTLKNKVVYLEKDVSETDQYGRVLRHVWLEVPDVIDRESIEKYSYGAIVLKEGYGQLYTFAPDVKYEREYLDISRQARDNDKGLWKENPNGTTRGTSLD